jgi:tetratricopeptide (TPR) repeat protein
MIALRTDELPADHDLNRYLATLNQLEMVGYVRMAEECYTTVLYQHPDNDPAVFGLANTMFVQRHYTTAATFYSYLLKRDPTFTAAANNLAEALAALGCYSEAIELLDRFL